jgi:hypothetical protein
LGKEYKNIFDMDTNYINGSNTIEMMFTNTKKEIPEFPRITVVYEV